MSSEETAEEFLARMRSVGFIGQRSRDVVKDGRDSDGKRYKVTKDQLGNEIKNSGPIDNERQDVTVRPQTITRLSANSRRE